MEIVDFRVRPRTTSFYRNIYPNLIPELKNYERIFDYDGRARQRRIPSTFEESIEEMRSSGVSKGVIFAGNGANNEEVFETCSRYPDVYYGLAYADPRDGIQKTYCTLEKAYLEYNLKGLNLSPWWTGVRPLDPSCYPLYALSEKLGKMVQIHASIHYNTKVPLEVCDPMQIDKLAVDFPELRIVMSHAGMGFGTAAVTVASRHNNVYLEFSGLHPKHLPPEMLYAVNTILKEKSLFGTNYPCLGFEAVAPWKKAIREENHSLFFGENAKRVLGVTEDVEGKRGI